VAEYGLIQAYVGKGKGKTTAALGTVIRAIGHGANAAIIQFMKGNMYSGEIYSLNRFMDQVDLYKFGWTCPHSAMIKEGFMKCQKCGTCFRENRNPDNKYAVLALKLAGELIQSQKYQIIVLDEIGNALRRGLVPESEVTNILDSRPDGIEIVLTGRSMPNSIMEMCHYVTEVSAVKHPFEEGVDSRRGIEY